MDRKTDRGLLWKKAAVGEVWDFRGVDRKTDRGLLWKKAAVAMPGRGGLAMAGETPYFQSIPYQYAMTEEYSSKLTSKGQITIPLVVRETLSLVAGDEVTFVQRPDGSFSVEARNLDTRSLRGIVRSRGTAVSLAEMDAAIQTGARRGER